MIEQENIYDGIESDRENVIKIASKIYDEIKTLNYEDRKAILKIAMILSEYSGT